MQRKSTAAGAGRANAARGDPDEHGTKLCRVAVGEQTKHFLSPFAESILLPDGRHGVVEAIGAPMAVQAGPHRWAPIDMALKHTANDFAAAAAPAGLTVRAPKKASEGVSLPLSGVSLTPVARNGDPLSGAEGAVEGASVFYAGAEDTGAGAKDLSVLVKPGVDSFEISDVLLSAASPEELYFRVGMPSGAKLVQAQEGGSIEVVDQESAIATVQPPQARDAAGMPVPVSMTLASGLLVLHVAHPAGAYTLPIAVDPTVSGGGFGVSGYPTRWQFTHSGSAFTAPEKPEGKSWTEHISGSHNEYEWGALEYATQGESEIVDASVEGRWNDSGANVEDLLNLEVHSAVESRRQLPVDTEEKFPEALYSYEVCAPALKCAETEAVGSPGKENKAEYMQQSVKAGTGTGAENFLDAASTTISQEKSPEMSFNTTSPTVREENGEYVPNALYPGNGWLSPHTAFEVHVKDPGMGVNYYRLMSQYQSDIRSPYEEGKCQGVQCPQEINQVYNYTKAMPKEGEVEYELFATDAAELYANIWPQKIKVYDEPPHSIEIEGLQKGDELGAGESQLTVKASDGKESKPSPGMRSIQIAIDGHEVAGGQGASCSPGPCTATGRWTVRGSNYAVGEHKLVVTATDNAGNLAKEEFSFLVHAASPVALGPGSLNPESGEFRLSASDVSMGGGLSVDRSYNSDQLTSGAEGPLGPQWTISLGGGDESLSILPDGSAILTSGGGGETVFARNAKGEFLSPPGDANLKLENREKEKEVTEYIVSNAKAGTMTRFTLPEGSRYPAPAYSSQFGGKGSEAGKLSGPEAVAVDPSGNVWVADTGNNRVQEFTAAGELVRSIGSAGSGPGQFEQPSGIAINQSTGDVYVADSGNHRVQELGSAGEYLRTIGSAGTGNGQFGQLAGIAVDAAGDVWVCDFGNDRVQEFSAEGAYEAKLGSEGTGNGQFKGPAGIAFSGGNVYVTDEGDNRVQELSPAGAYLGQFGSGGTGAGQLSKPHGIAVEAASGDLYVVDAGNKRVQQFTAAGRFLAVFGGGTGAGEMEDPQGIATSGYGEILVTDAGTDIVSEWEAPETVGTWLPTIAEGAVATGTETYRYKDVEIAGKQVIEPIEALAPVPTGVSCAPELKAGCRALTFNYAEASTAKGEAESEWGDQTGDLTRVYFTAWNAKEAKMKTVEVAHYLYDKQGRLRAEWDPRVKPELKTVYGYDEEGHLTSMMPPGQQGWAFVYGTISGDRSTGRLLKVTRAQPQKGATEEQEKAELGQQREALKNTEAPKVTGAPVEGMRIAVSNGLWASTPIVYAYQWDDCNISGVECTPIPGATNANYTPTAGDFNHTIVAKVIATDGAGSVTAASAATGLVSNAQFTAYAVKTPGSIAGFAGGPDGNLWFTKQQRNPREEPGTIGKMTTAGAISEYSLKPFVNPHETFAVPGAIVSGPEKELWYTINENFEPGQSQPCGLGYAGAEGGGHEFIRPPGLQCKNYQPLSEITGGPDGAVWFTQAGQEQIDRMATTGGQVTHYLVKGVPRSLTSGPDKRLWFTDGEYVGAMTTSGEVHEFALPAGSNPQGITSGPDGALWFAEEGTNKIGRITTEGAITEYALPAGSKPSEIIAGPESALWFTEGTEKVGRITTGGTITEYAVPGTITGGFWVAAGGDGNVWIAGSNVIDKITLKPTEGEARETQPGSTVEYDVPVTGTGAPYAMGVKEVEKWGQKDEPAEATAIFPPDEPQGWPAKDYKKATIYYHDVEGRAVNLASPSGGIATSEYNATNDVVRSLSADNREKALKEVNPVEAAQKLDTESRYNAEGSELLETTGPEHKVKLSGGEEVSARNHVRYLYDEGTPEGREYGLVTKTTDGALLSNGEERDVRTTLTGYSGQEGLGWKLRQPTSTTVDPAGLDLVSSTRYNRETGAVEETRSPGGNSELVSPPSFSLHFGGAGAGGGQFKEPQAVAVDSAGNVWAVDTGNDRVEKFTASGTFVAAYGGEGSGALQFKEPAGVAVSQSTGEVFVSDAKNNRVEVLNSSGGFVEAIGWGVSDGKAELEVCKTTCQAGLAGTGNGQLSGPAGVTLDSKGDLWVVDAGNDRVQELNGKGEYVFQFGGKGSGNGQLLEPAGVAISEGSLYVVDHGNDRVQQFSTAGVYMGQFGGKGAGAGQLESPFGIAANPTTGVLYVCDDGNERMEEFSPAGKFLTQWQTWAASHEQIHPRGVAVNSTGDLYIIDHVADVVGEWAPPEAGGAHLSFATMFGSKGSGNGQLSEPGGIALDGKGNVWVSDYANNRVQEFSGKGAFLAAYGKEGAGEVQFKKPTRLAVNKSTGNVYVTDMANNRVEELSSTGAYVASFGTSGTGALKEPIGDAIDSQGNVWVADRGNNRIVEFSSTGVYIAAYGKEGTGELQFKAPDGIAFSGENVYVTDSANHRVQEITNKGVYVRTIGLDGSGSGEFFTPEGIAADAAGNLYVSDINANHIQELSPTGAFKATYGSQGTGEGHFEHPIGLAIDPAGDLYVVDNGNSRIQLWDNNQQAVHDAKTIYYTATANSEHKECGEHPEWISLTCRTEPAAQPATETGGPPPLPTTVIERYSMYGQPEVATEAFGATTRTKSTSYDEAGRVIGSEETSSSTQNAAQPAVKDRYSEQTGALVEQSTEGTEGHRSVVSAFNTLGQLTSYTDAGGNATTYSYDIDGRVTEVNYDANKLAGPEGAHQTYAYNETTGALAELKDSAAGVFKATYDVEGNMTGESYPNGMSMAYGLNVTGEAISLEYVKTTHCSTGCTWFSQSVSPSIHGEALSQSSTLGSESYAYDADGRLAEVRETPAEAGCTTRLYGYDEEGDRTSLITRKPGAKNECVTEGGEVQRHLYDEAGRLADEFVSYDKLGNITGLPAADAGGSRLESSFFADGQARTEIQEGKEVGYSYDPAGRLLETSTKSGVETVTAVTHYVGASEASSWSGEGAGKGSRINY